MESLQSFWTWIYIFGIGSFYLLVLAVIPLGFRDVLRLFRDLDEDRKEGTVGTKDS